MSAASAAAIERARERRVVAAGAAEVHIQHLLDNLDRLTLPLKKRMEIAVEHLHSRITRNISVAVKKEVRTKIVKDKDGKDRRKQHTVVTERSKPGEYPRADTTQLMKTLLSEVKEEGAVISGHIGTPLEYGLILEVSESLRRTYLRRTLEEELPTIQRILVGSPLETK